MVYVLVSTSFCLVFTPLSVLSFHRALSSLYFLPSLPFFPCRPSTLLFPFVLFCRLPFASPSPLHQPRPGPHNSTLYFSYKQTMFTSSILIFTKTVRTSTTTQNGHTDYCFDATTLFFFYSSFLTSCVMLFFGATTRRQLRHLFS